MSSSMALQLRPKYRPILNPAFVHLFSSSSSSSSTSDSNDTQSQSESSPPSPPSSQSQSSFSSYFSDVKASLKQHPPPSSQPPLRRPSRSLEEIRKNLADFRRRSAADPSPPPSSQHISFQELYKRNVIGKPNESSAQSGPGKGHGGGKLSFDAIRESLRQMRSTNTDKRGADPMSLSAFKESLKLRPDDNAAAAASKLVIGGRSETLPASVFGKEMRERKEEEGGSSSEFTMKTEFVKTYSFEELGEKLRMLRPEKKTEDNWFSLGELNERLMKLREIEEKETASNKFGGVTFKDLRESLVRLKMSEDDKAKKSSLQRLDILGQLGGTPNFMLSPPQEHLVEKFFHPDNMSSAEKLKIELEKVRDEFKMSESDCGSSRVQVAQLTTKIKHLATVLHKKDKHSRKGLVAMVQKRKKLLKYLRRTDWDSYCLVLSRLGLRDNPDYKH